MTKAEETLIDIKFILDMYSAGVDTAENTLEKVREILKPVVSLTDDQQVVLEWLKEKYSITDIEPIELFWRLHVNTKNRFKTLVVFRAYKYLTRKAQLEVLQVFSQWALEQEEENVIS
ncbi:hypothetical protein [Enterococcus sp. JM9B]|uniref:hypothetical protein n=1 Tax=Enterococcus sp. JM9B TaxID=1857216 RepID=UPI001E078F5B|nr:hypothetical protein [Enterococcus sp. JM9B]KAF1303684.1 hypothetical protein BAU16_03720 [Enterococcus sp. JM9B]